MNSLHENSCFSMVSVFRGVPLIWGIFLASCWPLAGLLLASSWPLAEPDPGRTSIAGLLLASCWRLAGLFLASCWLLAGFKLPHEDFSRKSVFGKLAKTMNSLHENGCFSWFRGVSWGPPHLGPLAGLLLASCWRLAGLFLASCWLLAGFKLPREDFSRKSVFGKLAKTVNSLHENGCFSMVRCFVKPSPFGVPSWPLGFLLASCWLRAGFLLASCWPLPSLLLASCWLQASPRGSL